MKTEKIVLSFIAVVVGLMVAGIAFYAYQTTKTIPNQNNKTVTIHPATPTPKPSVYLFIDTPTDLSVTDSKTLKVSGKTAPDATLIISTGTSDVVITPQSTGSFSSTITIQDGENQLLLTAIAPNGEETKKTLTVTYSTENF
ncbi:MAG: hypothetical protein ACREGI_04575 [Candidatus Levyibacteriota bacterium]